MSIAVSTIRQRIATAIAELADWTESPFLLDLYDGMTGDLLDGGFAVWSPATVWTGEGRQRSSEGALVDSSFVVRWSLAVPSDGQVVGGDVALDAEAALAVAVRSISHLGFSGRILLTDATRVARQGDRTFIVGDISFRARHLYALE